MDRKQTLESARAAFERRAWDDAWAAYSAADATAALEHGDLEKLATAAVLAGRDEESDSAWMRAYRLCLDARERERAVHCMFWLTFRLLNNGHIEQANGWITKTARLLADSDADAVERGQLAYLTGLQAVFRGEVRRAMDGFERAAAAGLRHGDVDLRMLGQTGLARMLIRLDQPFKGTALLDEVMVALAADEVSPLVVGDVYCTAIEGCYELYDVRRAQEWTSAMTRWCDTQPELVLYQGQCLVHRSELLQLRGLWPAAMEQAQHAREQLSRPTRQQALGAACYQEGELHRLRGEFGKAEAAYVLASRHGREPQPGLALLRLAQHKADVAATMVRRVVSETDDRSVRSRILPAYVEIMLANDDVGAAREAVDELSGYASELTGPLLQATTAQSLGAVLIAEGEPREALTALRRGQEIWSAIDAPYDGARTRVLIGTACAALGDDDSAILELDDARRVYEELGAVVDLRSMAGPHRSEQLLTNREVEVLRLVASGLTNRAIATELVLSERTVERHVSNIFTKLDLSTRSAATAYAFEHALV